MLLWKMKRIQGKLSMCFILDLDKEMSANCDYVSNLMMNSQSDLVFNLLQS